MSGEEVETALSLAFGDLSLTVSRRRAPGGSEKAKGTPCSAAEPPRVDAAASSSAAAAPSPKAAASVAAKASWGAREAAAEAAGIAARHQLNGESFAYPLRPAGIPASRVHVVLRTVQGFTCVPAEVGRSYAAVRGSVEEGVGTFAQRAKDSVFHSFPSEREAKIYVAAAGCVWPADF